MLKACNIKYVKLRYISADSWFSSISNIILIHEKIKKHFILALKSNRLIALNREETLQERFHQIDSLDWSKTSICG